MTVMHEFLGSMNVAHARSSTHSTTADPIVQWARQRSDPTAYPQHGLLLKFIDPAIENNFLQCSYDAQRHGIQLNIALTIVFLLLFAAIDPLLLHADLLFEFRVMRFAVLVPLSLLALGLCLYLEVAARWVRVCLVAIVLFGLCWTMLLWLGGSEVLGYLSLALIQTIVGTFFLLGLPIGRSLPAVALFTTVFTVSAFSMHLPIGTTLTYTLGCLTVAMVCAFGAFRSETASRRQFVSQAVSDAQYSQRLATEHDRNRWLELIAAFLRHELKNAMIGVSTSVELASRTEAREQQQEYLARAKQSLDFMRRLLAQVADATSVEAALIAQEVEAVNFSELTSGRAQDMRLAERDRVIDARISSNVWVVGNADSLVQMLDKLIDNALEHGDPSHPVKIELTCDAREASLGIEDRGEPLSHDLEALFQPFVSNKTPRAGSVNLGLGLFIARTIAAHHGGSIEAYALDNPPGARFLVRLPLRPSPELQSSAGEPAIPAPALSCDTVK